MHRRSPQHFWRRQRRARCHLRPHRLRKHGSRDKFGAATVSVAECFRIAAETAAATAIELSLRELEAFARAGLSGFFALLHPRIASKQTLAFQSASQIAVGLKDRKSTRLNSSHRCISYAVFCLKKKRKS